MAPKKPAISLGPISDDLARIIKKAYMQGGKKTSQARRILGKLESKAGGFLSNTPTNRKVKEIRKGGQRGLAQTQRSVLKRSEMAKTTRMANEHMNKQTLKGLNWDGSPNKASQAYQTAQRKARAEAAAKTSKDKLIKSVDKQMSKSEAEKLKGTGRYVSPNTGKVTNVSPKRAAVGRSKAGAIPAQMGKRNANLRAVQAGMRSDVKAAKTPAARLQATRILRNHQNKYGTFGK